MAGRGKWTVQQARRNCHNCPICNEDPEALPHGPYNQLRRRNPNDAVRGGQQDSVYMGRVEITEEDLKVINREFLGAQVPTKEAILAAIAA